MEKKRKAAFFALCFLFAAAPAFLEEYARVTVDGKLRQALIIEGKESGLKGFEVYAQNAWRDIYLGQESLEAVRAASEKYLLDFDGRKLKKGKKNSAVKYGSAAVRLEWGSGRQAINRAADTEAHFGYAFFNGSPYFLLSIDSAQNQKDLGGGRALQESAPLFLLFTKAQIADLLKKLQG